MIPVEQLMIGDWVAYRHDSPDRVDGFAVGGNPVHLEKDGWRTISAINPIPLTTEILENNFPDTDTLVWWPSEVTINYAHKLFHIETAGHVVGVSGEFRYVHRLQQAFRLCGIEHEIKL